MSPDDRTFDERLKRIEYKLDVIGGIAIGFLTIGLGGLTLYILEDQWEVPKLWAGLATAAAYIFYTSYALHVYYRRG
jgi:hypothetical protein